LTSPHGLKNPILMDFDITMVAADAVNFIYVLPIGEQRLFVEATIFSYDVAAKTDFYRAIDDWLDQHFAESILRNDQHEAEFATIPMGQVRPIEPSLVGCGVGGGATRASTGYAFKGAERQIQQLLLQAVSERRLQHVEAYSRRARLMDAIFLEVTKTDIQVLPELFGAMASRLNGDDFADFLSDSGGWGPLIRTILAAPKWPFIKAAGRLLVPRR
jgi:lycopene beta-cyclase